MTLAECRGDEFSKGMAIDQMLDRCRDDWVGSTIMYLFVCNPKVPECAVEPSLGVEAQIEWSARLSGSLERFHQKPGS